MRTVRQISEEKMVSVFLQGELKSERYRKIIEEILKKDGMKRRIIEFPDTDNQKENAYREHVLGLHRGYKENRELFENFPDDMQWEWAVISKEELPDVRYIDYSYWNELSGGTRLPAEAAKRIAKEIEVYGKSNNQFIHAAKSVKPDKELPPLILVGTRIGEKPIVLEGCVRLTAYCMALKNAPEEISVIVGYSPQITEWGLY